MPESVEASEAARSALRKCTMRMPGQGVTLTDDEIDGLFDWLTRMGMQDAFDCIEEADRCLDKLVAEHRASRS